jgi:intracellular sulfur oxidation DsrE/DsrF family protein
MAGNRNVIRAMVGVSALLIAAQPWAVASAAQRQSASQIVKQPIAKKKPHHLILQVNTNDAAMMNLALNNATNVSQYYSDLGEDVVIEVVAYGPGLHMLREDTSPVKTKIKAISEKTPEISFKACGNTKENMSRTENKEIALISEAAVVKSGVVRVMELQEQGWAYVKP